MEEKPAVKYLVVVLDPFVTFQGGVKNKLRKIACGIKTLQSIRKPLTNKNRLLLLKSSFISHLHHPGNLLSSLISKKIAQKTTEFGNKDLL